MKTLFGCTVLCLALLPACGRHPTASSQLPGWVSSLIVRFESQPVGNPPQSIYRYMYRGETVYYVPPQCCDQ